MVKSGHSFCTQDGAKMQTIKMMVQDFQDLYQAVGPNYNRVQPLWFSSFCKRFLHCLINVGWNAIRAELKFGGPLQ